MWKIEGIVSKGDYNYAIVLNHPNATENGYVLEHRVVVENEIGRILKEDEIIHHKNGNKKDNRFSNLEILSNGKHASLHGLEKGKTMVRLKCPSCGKEFIRHKSKTFLSKNGMYTCCDRSCNGRFSRIIQLDGYTSQVLKAIEENFIEEFNSNDQK